MLPLFITAALGVIVPVVVTTDVLGVNVIAVNVCPLNNPLCVV